ncbi:MAG TPA: alpha/beta hydrolase [Anaerolineaceae bacterium]|nr:alpha/beta hydrolase [Anaerolineaceae bacterium]
MKKINGLTIFFILVLLGVIIGPLIIPIPPLLDILPVEELVYPDSQFKNIDGINIHYQAIDLDQNNLLILLHGFGSSSYSWNKVMEPLAMHGTVIAFDRPAFGLTERVIPFEDVDFNPYTLEFQPTIVLDFIQDNKPNRTILVGNSAGGTVALKTVLEHPGEIDALILVSPAVYGSGGAPKWIRPLLNIPHFNRLGPVFVRSIRERGLELLKLAWFNPEQISEVDLENYQKPLSIDNWDRALWEFTKANGENDVQSRLSEITIPVLVISGEYDQIIPKEQSIQLASELPNADLVLIPNCGHVPQEECQDLFLNAIDSFLSKYETQN